MNLIVCGMWFFMLKVVKPTRTNLVWMAEIRDYASDEDVIEISDGDGEPAGSGYEL